MKTKAVQTIIQTLLATKTPCETPVSSANAVAGTRRAAPNAHLPIVDFFQIMISSRNRVLLDRGFAAFAGANPHHVVDG